MKLVYTLLFLMVFFHSCNNENLASTKQPSNTCVSAKVLDNVESTENRRIITKKGVEIISLGDSLNKFDLIFKDIKQVKMYGEGVAWPKHVAFLNEFEWIEVEAEDGEIINVIRTNSSEYETYNGIRVGQKVSEIKKTGEQIDLAYDLAENLKFKLLNSDVLFSIDSLSQNQYFTDGGSFPENLSENSRLIFFEVRR